MVVLAAPVNKVDGYKISYFNCNAPTNIQTYSTKTYCEPEPPSQEKATKTYHLFQTRKLKEIVGFACTVRKSDWSLKCGVWSHVKMLDIPHIDQLVPPSINKCREMVRNLQFHVPGMADPQKITLNIETRIPYYPVGMMYYDGSKMVCQGQQYKVADGRVLDDVVKMTEYRVLIEQEKFASREGTMESITDHVSFGCRENEGGCMTGTKTFVWAVEPTPCALERINTIQAITVMDTYILGLTDQVLVNVTGDISAPGCAIDNLKMTEYEDLFIAETDDELNVHDVVGRTVDMMRENAVSRSYLAYALEQRMVSLQGKIVADNCQAVQLQKAAHPIPLGNGRFGRIQGEILYTFSCPSEIGDVASTDKCYDAIPLANGAFVIPTARTITSHATQIPCNSRFPVAFKSESGWVELLPRPKPRPDPLKNIPNSAGFSPHHFHFNTHSLYNQSELEQWSDLLEFPAYHHAMEKQLFLGSCVSSGKCKTTGVAMSNLPAYDLTSLTMKVASEFNIWQKFSNFIRKYGDIMAFIVICIFVLRLIMDLTMITLTIMQSGPGAALALIFRLYLGNKQSFERIRAKHRQQRARDDQELQPLHSGTPAQTHQSPTAPPSYPTLRQAPYQSSTS